MILAVMIQFLSFEGTAIQIATILKFFKIANTIYGNNDIKRIF